MYKVGLSTNGKTINESFFKELKAAGISCVEYSAPPEEYLTLDFNMYKALADKYGIELWSFHLPFTPFQELDISRPDLAEKSVKYLGEYIKKAGEIGIKRFVIHASGEPIKEEDRKLRMETAKKSLNYLCTLAEKYDAVICVEDLPRTCLGRDTSDILELLTSHPNIKACFDTNHMLEENNADNIDFIYKVGKKIETIHVSDYDFINERHWLPGEGKNDWQGILKALKDVGYNGPWLYEIEFKCPGTIIRPRDLNCEDFSKNAREIFENKEITLISTPKENLGYWG